MLLTVALQPMQSHVPEAALELATPRENVSEMRETIRSRLLLHSFTLERSYALVHSLLEVIRRVVLYPSDLLVSGGGTTQQTFHLLPIRIVVLLAHDAVSERLTALRRLHQPSADLAIAEQTARDGDEEIEEGTAMTYVREIARVSDIM